MVSAEEILGIKVKKLVQMGQLIRSGFSYSCLGKLMAATGMDRAQLGKALGLNERSLARHKLTGQLSSNESNKIYRCARVVAKVLGKTGNLEAAQDWLIKPSFELRGIKPIYLLATDAGTEQVLELLNNLL